MGVNRVEFAGNTLIDLTSDTVTADKLLKGYTAHDKAGELVVGALDVNMTKPNTHIEIASVGIWNTSRAGTTTFTFGNSVNRRSLSATYDVSNAQYIEFDLYIPSGKDISQVTGETQFELSSGGKEDVNESTIAGNFLSEYDINYGDWTHICIPLARFVGACDYSALNFVGWYWVGSSYSITGCKVANLTFTRYNLQSKTVTPSEERQEIFPDSDYSGLSSVIVEAAVGGGLKLPEGYAIEMGVYVPDTDKSSAVTIDLQNTFRWADTGKTSACYILMVGVDIRKGTQAAGLGAHVKFGIGERNHQMVTTTSGCSTSSTIFTNPVSTTTFNKITLTGTAAYPLKAGHTYLWMVIGELAA